MRDIDADTYVPGHGPILKGASSLDRHISFYKDLRSIINDAIKDNISTNKIEVPDIFGEPEEGRKTMTVNTWLNFYKNK